MRRASSLDSIPSLFDSAVVVGTATEPVVCADPAGTIALGDEQLALAATLPPGTARNRAVFFALANYRIAGDDAKTVGCFRQWVGVLDAAGQPTWHARDMIERSHDSLAQALRRVVAELQAQRAAGEDRYVGKKSPRRPLIY